MGMSSGGDDQGMMAEINVTPFVDVMLVLLIIFMVTTPIIVMDNQLNKIDVAVPEVDAENLEAPETDHLTINIDAEGRVSLGDNSDGPPITMDELEATLAAIAEVSDDPQQQKQVFLNADGKVHYSRVAEVMAACSRAGIADLSMLTKPEGAE